MNRREEDEGKDGMSKKVDRKGKEKSDKEEREKRVRESEKEGHKVSE